MSLNTAMTPNPNVNPELIKKCAELAFPNHPSQWVLLHHEDPEYVHAIMKALMKEENGWWDFGEDRNRTGNYEAHSPKWPVNLKDKSFPLLLLKCVSAQTSIPLYLE